MNKSLKISMIAATAVLTMGLSVPSCPGQQAMQQQIDSIQTKEAENTRKVQALENQIKTLSNDMIQVKTLLAQVSNTVLAQKQAIDQMDQAMKAQQAAAAAAAAAKTAPRGKIKGRR